MVALGTHGDGHDGSVREALWHNNNEAPTMCVVILDSQASMNKRAFRPDW